MDFDDPVLETARASLGITYLYPYQRLVVANTIDAGEENRAQVVVLPTGSGKTLCFTLPMLLLGGLTVVVYPLLALMDDQLRRMRSAGVTAGILRGGQSAEERSKTLRAAAAGSVRCLLANPEVLAGEQVRQSLSQATVSHFVIDEAHCVSEWGSTFRPSYLTLAETIRLIRPRVVTAFTATASPTVLESLCTILFGSRRPHLILGNPDRPNISYAAAYAGSKEAALHCLLGAGVQQPAIVFCRSRKRCEGVAREIATVVGFENCSAYHAGLTAAERASIEQWFFEARTGVLAATCAYGMGVDKPNIRTVIHYEPPSSVEAFLQESGRAGRDASSASSILLWNDEDRPMEREPVRAARERIMHGYLTTNGCRRAYLMDALAAGEHSCFGCDRCGCGPEHDALARWTNEAHDAADQVVRVARRRPRVYTPRQLAAELQTCWSEQARIEFVVGLIRTGLLTVHRHGPWRGRVAAALAFRGNGIGLRGVLHRVAPERFDVSDKSGYCK